MSNHTSTANRRTSSFASRLLHKALKERDKKGRLEQAIPSQETAIKADSANHKEVTAGESQAR